MNYIKSIAGCALAVGLLAAGTTAASAQDWRSQYQVQDQYGNPYYRPNYGNGYNRPYNNAYGYSNTYDRIEELQEHIAHDHAKLNEAIRCGNDSEAARQAADLARATAAGASDSAGGKRTAAIGRVSRAARIEPELVRSAYRLGEIETIKGCPAGRS